MSASYLQASDVMESWKFRCDRWPFTSMLIYVIKDLTRSLGMVLAKCMHFFKSSGTHGKKSELRFSLRISAKNAWRVGVYSLISFIPNFSKSLSTLVIFFVLRLIYPKRTTLKMGKNSEIGDVKY